MLVVALDLNITDDLKNEGIAREFVRNIQDARKQLNLEITDRILLHFVGKYPKDYLTYILGETLGDYSSENLAYALTVETEGTQIQIKKK